MKSWLLLCVTIVSLIACGNRGGGGTTDASGSNGDGGMTPDGPFSGMCTPANSQCANCVDDDRDGRIDGFDPHCTGPHDNDEASFATGIPGDNKDAVAQDCFFDGNSGGGNDGCSLHVCCLLGARTVAECPIGANRYNPKECPEPLGETPISQDCIDHCGKLTPAGCDCFGCCTICDPARDGVCRNVVINPQTSPGCAPEFVDDPTKCRTCTKVETCGNPDCGDQTCILCPGQDPSDLPPGCNGNMCPDGVMTCTTDSGCPTNTYCSNGCCVDVIF
jgi:hypothetical protein